MTENRANPGPLVFRLPDCPLCGVVVDEGETGLFCYPCGVNWYPDGMFRRWLQADIPQCDSVTCNPWTQIEYRCVLDKGHADDSGDPTQHKHPQQANWRVPRPAGGVIKHVHHPGGVR